VFEPAEQEQALSAPERLFELGKVPLAELARASSFVVVAEHVVDLADGRFALGLPLDVAELDENTVGLLDELKSRRRIALLAAQLPEQPQCLREVLLVAGLLESGPGDLRVHGGLAGACHMPQRLRLPAVLERERVSLELALQQL
jgi:hypothetical protein